MDSNLICWSIDRKHTNAHKESVINHMKLKFDGSLEYILPPLFFKDVDEMSDDEVRLLDNFTYLFFKGEECGCSIWGK